MQAADAMYELRPLLDSSSFEAVGQEDRLVKRNAPWSERKPVKRRYLSTVEAASLIINKMIGTGIFTTPALVLGVANNKILALMLWVAGALYAALCLFVYLDFAIGLPYNGAELIYLNCIYGRARIQLLPPVLYASYFIVLYHTAGNAISFAEFVLSSIGKGDESVSNPNEWSVKVLAILALTVVCFLLWIHHKTGLVMSKMIAAFKLTLLIVLGIWGLMIGSEHQGDEESAFKDWLDQPEKVSSSIDRLAGFIYVVYSYGGWESACFVIGEFDKNGVRWKPRIRYGAMLAIVLVGVAYTLFVAGFLASCTFQEIIQNSQNGDFGIASVFINKITPPRSSRVKVIKSCIGLSGAGNLVAVVYTSTKVKQSIALHHFLPLSEHIKSDWPFGTPGGAILLHWIISSIWILSVPANNFGYAFLIGLLTYGQMIAAAFVGFGRFKLKYEAKKEDRLWEPWIQNDILNYGAGFLLCALNVFICIVSLWRSTVPNPLSDLNGAISTRWWAGVLGICLSMGFLYWSTLLWLQYGLGDYLGWKFRIKELDYGSDWDPKQRRERRNGAKERYVQDPLVRGKLAYKFMKRSKRFWNTFNKYL